MNENTNMSCHSVLHQKKINKPPGKFNSSQSERNIKACLKWTLEELQLRESEATGVYHVKQQQVCDKVRCQPHNYNKFNQKSHIEYFFLTNN